MFGIGLGECAIIIIVTVIVIPPQQLPKLFFYLGKGFAKLQLFVQEIKATWQKNWYS